MPHRIALVVFPGFQVLDAAGPATVFEEAQALQPDSYTVQVVAPQAGQVLSSSGIVWLAQALPDPTTVDTLLLSGGNGVDTVAANTALTQWLRHAATSTARVASVCSGSLWLAAAGLLDGRQATTHWGRTAQFQQQYPNVDLQPDRIFVRDGRFWTSAGITAGIDLALALVAEDWGDRLAQAVARQMVVYYRRPGGQTQFSELLSLQTGPSRFSALLDHVRSHLQERHSVADLAALACMSPRHFARMFQAETGCTPAKAVEKLRAEAARSALENGGLSAQQAARQSGFSSAEQMRRSFVKRYGLLPSALRHTTASRRG